MNRGQKDTEDIGPSAPIPQKSQQPPLQSTEIPLEKLAFLRSFFNEVTTSTFLRKASRPFSGRPVLVEDFDDSFTKWEDEWFLGGLARCWGLVLMWKFFFWGGSGWEFKGGKYTLLED